MRSSSRCSNTSTISFLCATRRGTSWNTSLSASFDLRRWKASREAPPHPFILHHSFTFSLSSSRCSNTSTISFLCATRRGTLWISCDRGGRNSGGKNFRIESEADQAVSEDLHILPPTTKRKGEFPAYLDLMRWRSLRGHCFSLPYPLSPSAQSSLQLEYCIPSLSPLLAKPQSLGEPNTELDYMCERERVNKFICYSSLPPPLFHHLLHVSTNP